MPLNFNFDNTYITLPEHFYAKLNPEQALKPELVIFNLSLAQQLGLCQTPPKDSYLAAIFSGQKLPVGACSIAQAYAGHQFGYFNRLGDGRAHLLGEHITPLGHRFDIQLKGSGKTPFARLGDGKATMGPMLREYLISEAMHALGIATTRSLAVVATGENIQRERLLPGAVLTRVAASHLRIGSFEYLAAQKDTSGLKILANYTISRHYPHLLEENNPYLALLQSVIDGQINLIVDWLRVGFIHGVMNTDNTSICGETIDYGPCAFMNVYDPATVFSSIDAHGRYAFGNQPSIILWNLTRFAETLLPLIHEHLDTAIEMATVVLNEFSTVFKQKYLEMMRSKLGLRLTLADDESLIDELLAIMQTQKLDYTNTFLDLDSSKESCLKAWLLKWQKRRKLDSISMEQSQMLMMQTNPLVIPRNHQVESALQQAVDGNMKPYLQLLEILSKPYMPSQGLTPYQKPPDASQALYRTFCGT